MQVGAFDARLDSADDDALELPRAPRLDQLAAEGAEQRLRHRGHSQLPHSLEVHRRLPDQRVAREAAQELRVVGVKCEHEAQPLETFLAGGAQHDAPVERLTGGPDLHALADPQRRRQRPVTDVPRRVARMLYREGERERAGGANDPLEVQLVLLAVSAVTPRSYARRRIGSASSSRPCCFRKLAQSSEASPALYRRPWTVSRSTARR